MVDFFTKKGTRFVSSYQVYIIVGKPRKQLRKQYYRWLRKMIIDNPTVTHDRDYIRNHFFDDHLPQRSIKDYLIRKHLAIALCIQSRTRKARELRDFINDNLEGEGHTPPSPGRR